MLRNEQTGEQRPRLTGGLFSLSGEDMRSHWPSQQNRWDRFHLDQNRQQPPLTSAWPMLFGNAPFSQSREGAKATTSQKPLTNNDSTTQPETSVTEDSTTAESPSPGYN